MQGEGMGMLSVRSAAVAWVPLQMIGSASPNREENRSALANVLQMSLDYKTQL
jgi:hypothetical protein